MLKTNLRVAAYCLSTLTSRSRWKSAVILLSLATVFAVLFVPSRSLAVAGSEDWSQFRGPNGSGVSATTGLPVEFGQQRMSSGRLAATGPFISGADA